MVKVDGLGEVFIASSFCRPVKYGKLEDELKTFKNQSLLVDNEIALHEEKVELKKIRDDINHARTKEIEVLSVFTAIITFLFGTIGFLRRTRTTIFFTLFSLSLDWGLYCCFL